MTLPASALTHQGLSPYPDGTRPLYVRLSPSPFQFAGQASNKPGTLVWRNGWFLDARIATGQSGCIFDAAGVLHIIEPGPGVTSQGYRYVAPDGRLVLGQDTYGPLHGLSEYTDLSDAQDGSLLIGQGHDGGGCCVYDGTLRVLETGDCRFVRVSRVGDAVAVAFVKPDGAVIVQTTIAELRACPPVVVSLPQPPPIQTAPPSPEPEPKPSMPVAPNQLTTVQNVIAAHPEINTKADGPFAPNRGGITQVVAGLLGFPWGRKSKDGSDTNLSDDALCYRLQDNSFEIYDILSGADGSAQWNYQGTFKDGENGYFKAVPVTPDPPPMPPPVPPAPLPDPRIDALVAEIAALKLRIEALEAQPAPAPSAHAGDAVEVSGSVSYRDVLLARTVTWKGKIL